MGAEGAAAVDVFRARRAEGCAALLAVEQGAVVRALVALNRGYSHVAPAHAPAAVCKVHSIQSERRG